MLRLNESLARILIGWRLANPGEEHTLNDLYGNRIVLERSLSQRPFRIALAKRWMRTIVQRKWKLNGESIIIDRLRMVHDGQHRLVGIVLAAQLRDRAPHLYDTFWEEGEQLYIDTFVHSGIEPDPEVVNTINTGLTRSNGDAFYQQVAKTGIKRSFARQHANVLSHAVRLVYLNMMDKLPSYGTKLENLDATQVEAEFPQLVEAVSLVFELNGGGGIDGRKLQRCISLGYAAGLLFCMSTYGSDPENPTTTSWEKSVQFWKLVASDKQSKTHPAILCRDALAEMPQSSGRDRDMICLTVSKAWIAFIDDHKQPNLTVASAIDARGNLKILDTLQLGAIDGLSVRRNAVRNFTE